MPLGKQDLREDSGGSETIPPDFSIMRKNPVAISQQIVIIPCCCQDIVSGVLTRTRSLLQPGFRGGLRGRNEAAHGLIQFLHLLPAEAQPFHHGARNFSGFPAQGASGRR